ncbi:MAG: dihydroorotase [Bacteroidales bacterium]|nr:dihydroorotase [Bacteroidales bacterium]
MNYYIKNATIVNEGESFPAHLYIKDGIIAKIVRDAEPFDAGNAQIIDARGKYVIPGVIDEHVHFREPGMTAKADIGSESRAAVAGGVTSFMEMPNTVPQTTTQALLQDKFDLAAEKSLANYSFYIGATNDNLDEIVKTDPATVCGVKLFMGSSTGNMLVDKDSVLETLFRESPCLIAAHCEDEEIIKRNTQHYKELAEHHEIVPDASIHPLVRTEEACYRSTEKAVKLAKKTGARLHVMHISTRSELLLFDSTIPLVDRKITAETCPHYLLFDDRDYARFGFAIKCNPAIKSLQDKLAIWKGVKDGYISTIGSDHAPHQREEKFTDSYFTAKSGFPSIQHNFALMADNFKRNGLTLEDLVTLICHNPATLYRIDRRGFIREGFFADLAIVDTDANELISNEKVHYKCGWTPYDGVATHTKVTHTFVNGNLVYENGQFNEEFRGERLRFEV